MKKYIIDYGTETGPVRIYAPRDAHQMPTGGKRGRVTGLSPAARRHLRQEIHRLAARWERLRPIFVTLTLPGKDWEQIDYRAAFKRWRERLRAEVPGVWGFWVLDFQRRGAAHFHLALDRFAVRRAHGRVKAFRQWVSQSWYESVGSGQADHLKAGTSVEYFKRLPVYLVKEISKARRPAAASPAPARHTGRFWGKIGAELIKAHQIEHQREVPETVFRRVRREIERSWLPRLLSWAKKSGQTEQQIWIPAHLSTARLLDEDTRARLFRTGRNRPAGGQAAEGLRKRPMTRAGHASPPLQKRPMTLRKRPRTRPAVDQASTALRKRPMRNGDPVSTALRKRPMRSGDPVSTALQKRPMTLRKRPMTRGEQSLGTLRKRPRTRGGGSSGSAS